MTRKEKALLFRFPDDCPIKCKKPTHSPVALNMKDGSAEYLCGDRRWKCWYSGIQRLSPADQRALERLGVQVRVT